MIGFIALAGIIVRNSILLVDFSRQAVAEGMPVKDAVIHACATRTRPIIITALALMIGSSVILSDPIFEGMAISLMMGGMVSTLLTLVVIPLGCVKYAKAMQDVAHGETANGAPMPAAEPAPKPLHVSDSNGKGVIGTAKSALAGLGDAVLFVGAALFGLARGLGRMVMGRRKKHVAKPAQTHATVVSTPVQETAKPEVKPEVASKPAAKPTKPKAAKPAAKPKATKPASKPATARKVATTAKPAAKPKVAKPAPKPAVKPKAAKPASKPATSKPKTKPATRKAATKPASKPATRRKAKPSGRRGIRLKNPNSDNQE